MMMRALQAQWPKLQIIATATRATPGPAAVGAADLLGAQAVFRRPMERASCAPARAGTSTLASNALRCRSTTLNRDLSGAVADALAIHAQLV